MGKKKVFTDIELADLSAEEIIDKIKYENYSLLSTLGSEDLRKEMVPVGRACNAAINYFFGATGLKHDEAYHNKAARRKLVKTLSRLTPGIYEGVPKDSNRGLVVGFNHPSLGEIARILTMKIDLMGDKPMYFPVNLPWYESLAPNSDKIERLGIILTPTITPSTWRKMDLIEGTVRYDAGKRLKKEFRDIYTNLSDEAVKNGGVIFVAPSATRQATVFKNEAVYEKKEPIIPTMSVLALRLYSDPKVNCDFLPLAVLPPAGFKRGLNFHKTYKLIPGKIMTADYIRKHYFTSEHPNKLEGFDWDFHKRIADELPKKFWY
ncbi:hypothetical protein IKE72_02860 [Candidatus Saccharibacteria bacterium]|nr:hypothetical protein [Candidatus Saccharibacteria bacterium]